MLYSHDGNTHIRTKNNFWLKEKKYLIFNGKLNEYWNDVTNNFLSIGKTPRGITNVLYRIKYNYKNRKFVCLSKDPTFDVSENKSKEAKFFLPIKEVNLLDKNENIVKDVTKKYMKIIGPNNDFHNILTPTVYDLFFYDDYEYLQIINILNQKRTFDKCTTLEKLL